ncbi:hypothetical protein AB0M47_04835 [Hamadaea sp. NPDC051192]|uniref:hypothetical protein n=1 Tax=Hamadaea sp. NPDC051192 TaxID=3154940 RepID=UPI00343BE6A8
MLTPHHASMSATLAQIVGHQQGHHGWSQLYAALHHLHRLQHPPLRRLLETCWQRRPHISDVHLITLLSIAVRDLALRHGDHISVFRPDLTMPQRSDLLANLLTEHEDSLADAASDHSNSFTGARRFLVPQLLLGHFAARHNLTDVRYLDLGTSIGLMPRQLNSRTVFEQFAPDLTWRPGQPAYVDIPLSARYGVDAHPLPTLDWIRSCYGPSTYYQDRFSELLWSLDQTADVHVDINALNILDLPRLARHIRDRQINAVTVSMVLYQYDDITRRRVIAAVVESLTTPGILLTMEPAHGLLQPGCHIDAYLAGSHKPIPVAAVSDAHFIGHATAEPGLAHILEPTISRRSA